MRMVPFSLDACLGNETIKELMTRNRNHSCDDVTNRVHVSICPNYSLLKLNKTSVKLCQFGITENRFLDVRI